MRMAIAAALSAVSLAGCGAREDAGAGRRSAADAPALPERQARYISRAVAESTAQAAAEPVVWLDAACCAGLDPELPERIAFSMLALAGDGARLFVDGRDPRQAARLVDRLDALGVRNVFLVTP